MLITCDILGGGKGIEGEKMTGVVICFISAFYLMMSFHSSDPPSSSIPPLFFGGPIFEANQFLVDRLDQADQNEVFKPDIKGGEAEKEKER